MKTLKTPTIVWSLETPSPHTLPTRMGPNCYYSKIWTSGQPTGTTSQLCLPGLTLPNQTLSAILEVTTGSLNHQPSLWTTSAPLSKLWVWIPGWKCRSKCMSLFCLSHPNNRIHILKGDGHTIDQVALLKQEVKYSLGVKVPNRVPTYPICLIYPSLCVLSGYVGYNFQHATEFCPEKPPGQQQSHWRSEKSRKLHSVLGRLPSPTACLGSSRLHITALERSILALFR